MGIQLITYDGRVRAVCTPRRVYLAEDPEFDADPSIRFVLAMCLYAGEVLNGHPPGPYREREARAYARARLIPGGLGHHRQVDIATMADELGVPICELVIALHAHRSCGARRRPRSGRSR